LALYGFLALIAIVVLSGHHSIPAMDRDESRFAQASRQMQSSGDFVAVKLQDDLRAKKPIGIYWLQAGFATLVGPDLIASYRFVNLLALLGAVFIIYYWAVPLYDQRSALASAMIFGGSFLVLGEAHLAKTDTVLMFFAVLQQWSLYKVFASDKSSEKTSASAWFWFWSSMAAGILTKGPVLPILAVLTILTLSFWHRNFFWLKPLKPFYGMTLLLLICLPWFVLVSVETKGAFLNAAIHGDFFSKITSAQESHGAPPGSYLLILWLMLWPASPLLVNLLVDFRKLLSQRNTQFLVASVFPFWIMMELVPTKLPHYILPVLPFLALLLAGRIVQKEELPPLSRSALMLHWPGYLAIFAKYFGVAAGFIFVFVAIWGVQRFGGQESRSAMTFAFLMFLLACFTMWYGHLWIKEVLWKPFFIMITSGVMLHFSFFSGVLPNLSEIHVSRAIADKIASLPNKPSALAAAGYHEPSLVFNLGKDLLLLNGREAALFLVEAPGGMAIVEKRQKDVFLEVAKKLGVRLSKPFEIKGFNISKGQNTNISLYQAEMFDARASKE